jgi:hypothetical protein
MAGSVTLPGLNPGDGDRTQVSVRQLAQALDGKVASTALNALISAYLTSLPTTLPATAGQLWINNGFLAVS